MDLSPHSGHSDGKEETVGFEQAFEQQGLFEEEEQEIEFEEGPPTQENVFHVACSDQFSSLLTFNN
jgi:hypothetical protein